MSWSGTRSSSDLSAVGRVLAAAAAVVLALPGQAQQPAVQERPAPMVQRITDLCYSSLDPEVCRIDVFVPTGQRNGCCIFFIHGGGWAGGSKESWHAVMEHFCSLGYVCTSATYHLLPDWRFPKQVEDVRLAMSFVKSRAAEWGVDPAKIAVMGSSAGGHLCAMLATIEPDDELGMSQEVTVRDTRPAAAVCLCSVLSCHYYPDAHSGIPKMLDRFLGTNEDNSPETVRAASPIDRITEDTPPFLMVVGDADETTPVSLHEAMAEALEAKGVRAEVIVLPGVKHGYGYGVRTTAQKQTLGHVERFLADVLGIRG